MKTVFLSLLVFTLYTGITSYNATAQITIAKLPIQEEIILPPANIEDMPETNTNFKADTINQKAVKHFQEEFKDAKNVTWSKSFDHGYIASFNTDSGQIYVAYNGRGNWHHTIHYYGEKNLPHDLKKMVHSNYYDYNIVKVAEIEVFDETVYMIYAQGQDDFKVIRFENGEMDEVLTSKKG